MALYREQGIVLRTYKLGETDRILHILTQGQGKVRAVAKGVRKPGSRFGGRLEPFSHSDLQLYSGRNLDIVTQAELINPFAAVREAFDLSACGSVMVESVDQVAQEDERSNPLFLLLLDGLRHLAAGPANPAAVVDAFLLRLATVAGWHPYLEACASCGAPGRHAVFHIAAGGTLCPTCAPGGSQALAPAVIDLLHAFAGPDWGTALAGVAEPRTQRSAAAVVNSFLTYHLGKPLKAWSLVTR